MAYAKRNDSFGGGFKGKKKFGGPSRSGGFSDRGGDRGGMKPIMYPATCSDCGSHCNVPFRPNGKKPVLCSSCFGKGQGNDFAPKFSPRDDGRHSGGGDVTEQLRTINGKLDMIIRTLKANDLSL